MIGLVLALLFGAHVFSIGLVAALIVWGVSLGFVAFIVVACYLVATGLER
jgi:hypothetical protein